MRAFAEAWSDELIVQQVVAQMPWGHDVRLLDVLNWPIGRQRNGPTINKSKGTVGDRKGTA